MVKWNKFVQGLSVNEGNAIDMRMKWRNEMHGSEAETTGRDVQKIRLTEMYGR